MLALLYIFLVRGVGGIFARRALTPLSAGSLALSICVGKRENRFFPFVAETLSSLFFVSFEDCVYRFLSGCARAFEMRGEERDEMCHLARAFKVNLNMFRRDDTGPPVCNARWPKLLLLFAPLSR